MEKQPLLKLNSSLKHILKRLNFPVKQAFLMLRSLGKHGLNQLNFPVKFSGQALFSHASFSDEVDFTLAKFSQLADFGGAIFSDEANFNATQFYELADFSWAQFSALAFFVAAIFSSAAHFTNTKFSYKADFSRTNFLLKSYAPKFLDKTDFGNTLPGEVDFTNTEFSGEALFALAKFSGEAKFLAKFTGEADFGNTQFSSKTIFTETIFCKKADFTKCSFTGEANFSYVNFSDKTYFPDVKFFLGVNFSGAKFSEAYFPDAKFSNRADFSGSTFSKEAYFSGEFSAPVLFNYTIFEQPTKVTFDISNMSNVSFANTDITRIRFSERARWGVGKKDKDRFKVIEERWLEDSPEEIKSLGSVMAVYRNLRENYEFRLRYDEAGKFFIREMELKRRYREVISEDGNVIIKQNWWFRRNLSLTGIYYHFSKYGESIVRPSMIGAITVVLSTLFWLMPKRRVAEAAKNMTG